VGGGRLGHRPALDGIRGVAILAVVGFHLAGWPAGGAYGVDLFFVLSGFLITTLLLEEQNKAGRISLRGFYVRRARRLFPALAAMLLVIAAAGPIAFGAKRTIEIVASSLYAANFVRAFAASDPLAVGPAGHLWSLAQEEQFYLVWPLILIVFLRFRLRGLLVGALLMFVGLCVYRWALAANGATFSRLYFGPDVRADGLMLGCAAAFAHASGVRVSGRWGWVGLAVFVLACLPAHPATVASQVRLLPVVEIGSALLILAVLQRGTLERMLAFGPLVWLGTISYSLYLWHYFAWWATGHRAVLALPISVVLALASYHLVERRFRHRRSKAAVADHASPRTVLVEA